ncbi:MAG: glycosyltransferase family 2 protein [Oligoflexia bacterium]|nr:glycosyltransferase family 2 protein [Oligoflexia bacterium]
MEKKLISIMSNCYNEEENVDEFYKQVKEMMNGFHDRYVYELLFIDNCSIDNTVKKIKKIIDSDKNVKLIVNARNFGQVRSPYYGLLQTKGEAVISMATDLQDPPYMIEKFINKWEEGYKNVIGVKIKSEENKWMYFVRKLFYFLIASISEAEQIKNFTGFGLYDKQFIDILRDNIADPQPYFRGLVAEFCVKRAEIPYIQPIRKKGKTKNNLFTLYDLAMIGFTNHSRLPLRITSFIGIFVSFISIIIAFIYFMYKLLYWQTFQLGSAPILIGIFFIGGVQLFFLGILGEYIGAIYTQVRKRPLVVEQERVNF